MRCGGTNHRRNSFHRRTLTFNNHCLLFSLKSRTIKINTESGKPDATYVVDWGAEDNVDGAIEDDDKTKYTFTSGTLVSLYKFLPRPYIFLAWRRSPFIISHHAVNANLR